MSEEKGTSLPYDERNQQDFLLVTKRIQDALEKMAADRRLKRTEVNLATLAGCSRGTLRNRKWPMDRLKKLQEEARATKENAEPEPRAIREQSRIERYRDQLSMNRDELLVWKYKHDELRDRILTLEAQRDSFKKRVGELEAQLRSVAISAAQRKANVTVLPVPGAPKDEPDR
ncbi:hypothetical protein Q3O98_21120 [Ralstonia pseudosolanacearum]|uniref:hypothetical protein n=1 Tax=Ralstonia pseudosolanacearum TaxID=1310165 RepID=UPI002676598D|nr:hypothetical protein [Ralstonia pseudosolanacearum]MDO3623581.1 hypothetical protein [Ralstonia pseudosolanacearum]